MQVLWERCARIVARQSTVKLLLIGYSSYVLLGWGLLALPWSGQGDRVPALDHLFMATSAVSTTGLATVSTADRYSFFGEAIIAALIQFGGLGYMTVSSFLVLAVTGALSPTRQRVGTAALSLPDDFHLGSFLKVVCWFTLTMELLGAAALYPVFAERPFAEALWLSVFHSISAFCTAGFGLFNNSFEDFRDDPWLNIVLIVLSQLGSIGFIVIHDLWRRLTGRIRAITFTTRIILWSTLWMTGLGTLLFVIEEPTIKGLSPFQAWQASLFQVMAAQTTVGFNTLPIGALSSASVMLLTLLMLVGASPAGTGGGIKTTTVTALWAQAMAVLRRRPTPTFLGRTIPDTRLRAAVANTVFYLLTLSAGVYLLALVEAAPLADQVFECASAVGTVGLSRGITGTLTPAGKVIIIGLMFLGRVGPIVVGMSLFREAPTTGSPATEDVVL